MTSLKDVVVPTIMMIGRGPDTEKLYKLERQRQDIIGRCAKEWAEVMEVPESEFWKRSLPQQLFDILESWERASAVAAAEAFLAYAKDKWPELER